MRIDPTWFAVAPALIAEESDVDEMVELIRKSLQDALNLVRRLSPAGTIVDEIKIPAKQPSSVMFGGEQLDQLYITTACQGAADLNTGMDKNGVFLGGKTYRCRMDVCGRAEWLADFE